MHFAMQAWLGSAPSHPRCHFLELDVLPCCLSELAMQLLNRDLSLLQQSIPVFELAVQEVYLRLALLNDREKLALASRHRNRLRRVSSRRVY